MYGNHKLPGVEVSEGFSYKGSIWRSAPEATWFKIVKLSSESGEPANIPEGTILKENTDGTYSPITASDITGTAPGIRLGIMADYTATISNNEDDPSKFCIGIQGQVDKAKLLIGETSFNDLADAQKINLNTQLEAWGFLLINVIEG